MAESREGVCKHGGLRRQCETCDLAEEVDSLALQADALREALRATLANLCQAHGLPAHIESQARAALGATEGKEEE